MSTPLQHPADPSFDELALTLVPVVLGGPSLRRRAGEPRHARPRRTGGRVAAGSPTLRPSDRPRPSTTPR